ncbi:hypothetical protein KJ758_01010 [Patescibacteria group bacterium]|nr:hypothetical protein [Patescibacteria group bacterium]
MHIRNKILEDLRTLSVMFFWGTLWCFIFAFAVTISIGFVVYPSMNQELNNLELFWWSFKILWFMLVGIYGYYLWYRRLKPTLRVRHEHSTSLQFAYVHRHSSEAFIRFSIECPPGYEPWDREAFLSWIDGNELPPAA